ncbi:MAG: hypothetical protein Q7T71_17110, partial [Herbiconiux sp.]|nr:hypothetical protein [Herbiconiux sp.]
MTTSNAPQGGSGAGPHRLAVGPDALDTPSGRIVAVCGTAGSGTAQLVAQARDAVMAPRGTAALQGGPKRDDAPSGVALVSVRSSLAPRLDVTENIFLNRLRVRRLGPVPIGLDWTGMRRDAATALALVGSSASVTTPARDLSELDAVLVELARVAASPVDLLVVEEPAALLHGGTEADLARVLSALEGFSARGTAVVVLTQKPRQALGYADAVAVARDGRLVARHERAEWEAEGVEAVRRRILDELLGADAPGDPAAPAEPDPLEGSNGPDRAASSPTAPELLRIESWSARDLLPPNQPVVSEVTLALAEGEILGLTGLERSGAETLLLSVYGRSAGVDATGRVLVRGAEVDTSTVQKAIEAGLFLATADPPRYQLSVV